MKLKDLKKGDKFKIEYAGIIDTARVIENYPTKRKIYIKIGWFPFVRIIKDYDEYNFWLLDDSE